MLPLTPVELNRSLLCWVRITQAEAFALEIKCLQQDKNIPLSSKIVTLKPFMDQDSVLRVGGRLRHSLLSPEEKNPILHGRLVELLLL